MIWLRLHDPNRTPAHWTEMVRPGQCVVFVSDAVSKAPRDMEGRPFCNSDGTAAHACAAVCEGLAEAERFSADVVARHVDLCCDVYDHEGKAGPPCSVIYDPSVLSKHAGLGHAKRQALVGAGLFSIGITLVTIDARHDLAWMWGYIFGLKGLFLGGIFLSRGFLEWCELRTKAALQVDSGTPHRID